VKYPVSIYEFELNQISRIYNNIPFYISCLRTSTKLGIMCSRD